MTSKLVRGGLSCEIVRTAITARQAFTLVEGEGPCGLYKGRIDSEELIEKLVRHEQSTLCLEQVAFYGMHNGRLINNGKSLMLPPITPWPELDRPIIFEIPDQLPLEKGQMISTTEGGTRERGRFVLHTSADNMPAAYKNLKPRWQISYRTKHQMIGAKPISEFFAAYPPGAQYLYGTVELAALEPAYVEHGRRRPKPGPLVEALDHFISEKVREIAQQINAKRQQKLDEVALDHVHEENRKLNEFKNQFLPSHGEGNGAPGGEGYGPRTPGGGGGLVEWGTVPDALEHSAAEGGLYIGNGVAVSLRSLWNVNVRDARGRPVRAALEWMTSDPHVAAVSQSGELEARTKGSCEIRIAVRGTAIQAGPVSVQVWNVDHVLLTPRNLDMPLGTRHKITAEVTDDEGKRSTNVLLHWRHDADDQMVVRVSNLGNVTANRLGRTGITAGAGAVWARLPVEVRVLPNSEKPKRGEGFPRLLLTGRDRDPATDMIREGDPDQPALWQEPSDFMNNVWWLNLQNPEAAFAFRSGSINPTLWRAYHAGQIVEMVVQVWMTEDFTRKGEHQRPDFWVAHLNAMDRHRVRIVQQMLKRLEPYITDGGLEDETQAHEYDATRHAYAPTEGLAAASAAGSA